MRVIAATHKDLGELVKKGEFREDLYYRINVIRVQLPPLRERRDDLPILIDHFLRKHHREGQRARGLVARRAGHPAAPTPGPATSASWRTRSSGCWCSAEIWSMIPADLISSRIRDAVVPGRRAADRRRAARHRQAERGGGGAGAGDDPARA